jgi:hypothetical protein
MTDEAPGLPPAFFRGCLIGLVLDALTDVIDFDLVVCMRADGPDYFRDNEFGDCSRCGVRIKFRPYVPKEPPKVCMQCARSLVVGEASYD